MFLLGTLFATIALVLAAQTESPGTYYIVYFILVVGWRLLSSWQQVEETVVETVESSTQTNPRITRNGWGVRYTNPADRNLPLL